MQNTIYSSFKIETPEPIDPRLYVSDMTIAALQQVFGSDGKWGFNKAVVFNKAANKFFYLSTFNTKADVIDPTKWTPVGSNSVAFPTFNVGAVYGIGNCITFNDTLNYESFYIALGLTTAGQSPESNPELWLDLQGSSVSGGVVSQRFDHRLNPADSLTHTISISSSSLVSDNGSKQPLLSVYADLNERQSANVVWEEMFPVVKSYSEGGVIKFTVIFSGDLTDIFYDGADAGQNNIKIVLR